MQVLIDTGVLLRVFDRGSSAQKVIFRALRKLWTQGHELATSHQNIAEFWNVATRPTSARGGFGLSGSEAEKRLLAIEKLGVVLPFTTTCYATWRQLLLDYSVIGVSVHDARLVAIMKANNISHIVTLNGGDFQRYDGIVVWAPEDVG
jgi:predicted nucleic acid-binding protein